MLQDDGPRSFTTASADFPLEETRLAGIYILTIIGVIGTVGYGVALQTHAVSRG